MLQEIETNTITLSQTAAQAVQNILNERKLEGYALRIFVSGSGCSGAKFGMALDNTIHDNDMSIETEGVKVVVDDVSLEYLRGAKVDFVNDPQHGAGFIVDSPLAAKAGGSCGCGSQGKSEAEGSSCGCGGSCGCN